MLLHAPKTFLSAQTLAHLGEVAKNVVSFFLGFTPGNGGGAAILGGVDPRLYKGKMVYHPVVKGTFGNWALRLTIKLSSSIR